MKCSLGVSNFLEEISSLSHSTISLYFFALITEEGFSSLLAILWNSAFKWVYLSSSPLPLASLLFSVICKALSDNRYAFLNFFFLGMVLIIAYCTMSRPSFHSSSGILSDLIPRICHFFYIIVRDLIQYHGQLRSYPRYCSTLSRRSSGNSIAKGNHWPLPSELPVLWKKKNVILLKPDCSLNLQWCLLFSVHIELWDFLMLLDKAIWMIKKTKTFSWHFFFKLIYFPKF